MCKNLYFETQYVLLRNIIIIWSTVNTKEKGRKETKRKNKATTNNKTQQIQFSYARLHKVS